MVLAISASVAPESNLDAERMVVRLVAQSASNPARLAAASGRSSPAVSKTKSIPSAIQRWMTMSSSAASAASSSVGTAVTVVEATS